jgi:hypothetical protein
MTRRRPAADRVDRGRGGRRAGAALLVAAVVVGVAGHYAFPRILDWLLFAVLAWGGVTLLLRDGPWIRRKTEPFFRSLDDPSRVGKLRPGEEYDNPVKLTWFPNVPLAESLCQRLHASGIEAFYKGSGYLQAGGGNAAELHPDQPAEVWVEEHQLVAARRYLAVPDRLEPGE